MLMKSVVSTSSVVTLTVTLASKSDAYVWVEREALDLVK